MAAPDRLIELVARAGGVAHTREAEAAGFRSDVVRRAVATGALRCVRRSWLIGSSADPDAVAAVGAGGRLACRSEARRLGLWIPPGDERLHISVAPTYSPARVAGIRYHSSAAPQPVARTAWHEPPINVLAHIAVCAPREDALAVWESAIRKRLVPAALARITWSSPRARFLAETASLLSDSGLETILFSRLQPFHLPVRQQVRIEGHNVDGLIGEALVVQTDGFAHHRRPEDRRRDIAHDARLALRGYTVLRFDYAQILFGWPEVERTILLAVAQGLHHRR